MTPDEAMEATPKCRFCANLTELVATGSWARDDNGMLPLRCTHGHFDREAPGSPKIRCYYTFSVIWEANKRVAPAQKDCRDFKVHPRVGEITPTSRPR